MMSRERFTYLIGALNVVVERANGADRHAGALRTQMPAPAFPATRKEVHDRRLLEDQLTACQRMTEDALLDAADITAELTGTVLRVSGPATRKRTSPAPTQNGPRTAAVLVAGRTEAEPVNVTGATGRLDVHVAPGSIGVHTIAWSLLGQASPAESDTAPRLEFDINDVSWELPV